MPAPTLDDHLTTFVSTSSAECLAVADVIRKLAGAAIEVREAINLGALGNAFAGIAATNAGGDVQKDLDVLADEIFLNAMAGAPVALFASEELENPVVLDREAHIAIAIDPLDGSSNIETNVSVGSIFSLLPVVRPLEASGMETFLQPGHSQLAAGFFVYGPQLALVLTLGAGTHIFVYSPRQNTFIEAYSNVQIAHKASEFAINASNYRHWDSPVRLYIDECLTGSTGSHGRDYNMRWIASLVADTYRILIRGGVFLYPGDSRKGYGKGRLRLLYEANPIAMLVEQAGGLATDCVTRTLDIKPTALHQRVPLVFGSASEVTRIEHYHAEAGQLGARSPLFGHRGLFRS